MVLPGLYAIFSPITVGFLIGPRCLTGLLGGSIASGMMLAVMMANAGGAWDNSKKYIEIEGAFGGKHTAIHKACIVGDTVCGVCG
jgi:K(+)-stimulated pyrophosphate-energized sodium pump